MAGLDYGPLAASELDAYVQLLDRCFGLSGEMEDIRTWVGRQRLEDLRTLREGSRPIAALSLVPMGQFLGGRSIPTAGVAGVGIDPDRRGRGRARLLMERFLEECHERDLPLSTLYASTYALYRGVGYERAGTHVRLRVRPNDLRLGPADGEIRVAEERDEPRMEEVWREWARTHDGQLDRGAYIRQRVMAPRGKPTHAWVVEEGGQIQGYVRWLQSKAEGGAYGLDVTDVAALTPTAARRILRLFADHGSVAPWVRWCSGPGDPLLALLPDRHYELDLAEEWMLRIVDVRAALAARGYPPGLQAEVHLEVEDELLSWNQGRFVLRVEGGRGHLTPGGQGRIGVSARGLAPLFTGHRSPAQLALAGWLQGSAADLAAAAPVFAGPAPWMSDEF